MEKIDMNYRQWIWKIEAKLFKPFNRDTAPLKKFLSLRYDKVGISLTRNSYWRKLNQTQTMSTGLISFSMTLLKSTRYSPPVYFGCESLDHETNVLITVSKLEIFEDISFSIVSIPNYQ